MIVIGYWIETPRGSPFPAPQECVGDLPQSTRARLVDYLESGRLVEQYRGYSWCRFGCGADARTMGSREFTDGMWLWPEGLSHYVREHSVILPSEFVSWVMDRTPCISSNQELHDFDFWIAWGKSRRNPEFRRHLLQTTHACGHEVLARYRALKRECVRASNIKNRCLWHNCEFEASPDRAFCPYHQLSPQQKRTELNGRHTTHLLETL